jgi:CRISPR-associated protein Csm2
MDQFSQNRNRNFTTQPKGKDTGSRAYEESRENNKGIQSQWENGFKPEWIEKEINSDTIEWCEKFGKYLAGKEHGNAYPKSALSTSQLRRFFGAIKRIQYSGYKNYPELLRLSPMLAYAVGKDKNDKGENTTRIVDFYTVIRKAIKTMNNKGKEEFNRFVQIVEAIVAYHKAAGGK